VSWQTVLAIGSGGFVGAILRAYITSIVNKNIPHDLPLGTLSVNLIGSFILGCLFAYFYTATMPVHLKSFLTTGMMGALTTYSTFAMETFLLLNINIYLALSNMALNLFGTIIMAGTGFKIASMIFGK
jgi:CrcB protein